MTSRAKLSGKEGDPQKSAEPRWTAPPPAAEAKNGGILRHLSLSVQSSGRPVSKQKGPPRRTLCNSCNANRVIYLLPLPGVATVRDKALVTNKLRLTPSFSARSTRAWCRDFGKR